MQLNFIGLVCPMPILKLKKYLAENKGKPIDCELLISDKSGIKDIPAFCHQAGLQCELLSTDAEIRFRITGDEV
ncbi:sulfurtransferase TusA family protein [Thiomicrorhabdus immobilis]|nr:sulfurtransferase TusA family protein [Thiomicrorhabdus immobilis]